MSSLYFIMKLFVYICFCLFQERWCQQHRRTFLEVETDPYKLCNFVCGANYFKEGEDPPIKPDSEYPEWLFSLHIDRKPIELSELSKDDMYYWRRLRRINMRRQNKEIKYAGQRRPKRIWWRKTIDIKYYIYKSLSPLLIDFEHMNKNYKTF